MKGLIILDWHYNDGYKHVFNKYFTYAISDNGTVTKFPTHDYRITANDIKCDRELATSKLIGYFSEYSDKLIDMAKNEVISLENKQRKELMRLRKDGLV